ncbi:filamentous hemagglutinin [Paraburkholderia bannensis]|uniref:Filamentous hemagglutinin n=1 Tax=Paraburkholderia bannensis TaxID=765414 RepID=A0A7W9TWP2_9BURK|nr:MULTISPECIES: hemagglutinin repeat-containing protein [Paraburkholderia]MBB3257759.1 filamentous hemagglutinin [Paraburkholderia sp. WP4_3_2]MBB6102772.1 filamentous hemagglutinin [Paraburkholderia bannensis]
MRRLLPAALIALAPMLSFAQIVAGGAHGPNVIQAPNGIDQVNINRASGAGVSVNTYNRFDVQSKGAILNNSPTMVQSQLGGMINGNPNFAPGQAARVIVNQVNSASPSQFNGALEVAGQRANVILANPSGISVNGGTFINTSRATLTTGTPNYAADGSLSGFNITGGNIAISGAGLNASGVDQVDLLSRAVQANAAIYAKTNLNVVTGANSVDYNTLNATPIAGDGAAPGVSIDVSNLGGMYAHRIVLVGTEAGVGVSLKGVTAAQAGDLVLTSAGKLVLAGQTNASGNIVANATGGIDNTGTTYAQQNVNLTTSGALTNSGTVAAQQNTIASAGSVSSTGTLAAGVNNDGSLAQSGDLNVNASGAVTASGRNVAGGNASVSGASVNLAGATNSANGTLSLTANGGDLNLSGATTTAGGTLNASASATLTNDNAAMSSGGAQTITAGALSNRGGQIVSGSTLTENIAGATNNQGGTMQATGALASSSGSLDNSGGTIASLNADGVSLATAGLLNNGAGGSIDGNGDVTLQGSQIANAGSITEVQTLIARAAQTLFNSGTFAANGAVSLAAGTTLTNTSTQSGGTLALSAATFDNSGGSASAGQFTLHAASLVNHGGTITQTGTGAMTLDVTGTLDNSNGGTFQTNSTDLALAPGTLDNDGGTITHAGSGALTVDAGNGAGSISNVAGTIVSNGTVVLQGGALNNTAGSVSGQNGLTATVAGTLVNTNGKLLSNADTGITSGALNNSGGQIGAGTNETISTGSLTNNGGSIVAPNLTLTGTTLDNSGGDIEANQLSLTAANFTNHSGTITQYGASAMGFNVSGTFDNSNGGTLQTNSTDFTLAPGALNNDGGSILDAGTGTLTIKPGNGSGSFSNVGGRIISAGAIAAQAASLNNANGVLAAKGAMNANFAGDVNNTQGSIRSLSSLSLSDGGTLTNTNGQIQAGTGATGNTSDTSTLTVQAGSVNNTSGLVSNLGTGDTTVQGGSQTVNSGGVITGNGAVKVDTSALSNTQNGEISGAGVTVQGDTVDNTSGQIGSLAGSNGDVSVTTTGAVTNANGQIGSTHNLSVNAAALTGGGSYSAANDVAVSVQGNFAPTPDVQFNAGHDLSFTLPGKDINVTGSAISLDMGTATLAAAGNVNIGAATETHVDNTQEQHKHSNVVSGKEVASSSNSTATLAQGSMVSADGVAISSGNDINVKGSTIVGTNDVALSAAHDVNITTTQDTMQSSSSYQEKRTGLGTSGLTVTVGTNKLATTNEASSVTNNASTVGSLNGDLSINAGNTLHVTGSDLVAGKNLAGTAANVIIDSATDTSHQAQTQKTSSSGLAIGLAGSLGDAINNAYSESQTAKNSTSTGNDRAAALHSIAAAGDVALTGLTSAGVTAGGKPDIGVKVSIGSSKSESQSSEDQTTQHGSSVQAGGTAGFVATSGDLTIAGSNVSAKDVVLAAKNQVNVINTTNTDSTRSSNSSSSASIGVQYTLGGGFGVSAAMANAHGDANSDASIQNASHVNGANSVTVISGGEPW